MGGVRDDIYISRQLDSKLAWTRREGEGSFGIRAGVRFSFVPSVANKKIREGPWNPGGIWRPDAWAGTRLGWNRVEWPGMTARAQGTSPS